MSGPPISKSVRGASINYGDAPRIYSERFLNPHLTTCFQSPGYDSFGREICGDGGAFARAPGCFSVLDVVEQENSCMRAGLAEHVASPPGALPVPAVTVGLQMSSTILTNTFGNPYDIYQQSRTKATVG
jgi:hypothetical protein